MALTYTWQFPTLDVVFDEVGMQNVVNVVHWVLVAQDEQYTQSAYGTVKVGAPDPQSFTPYEQLTKAEIESWVEQTMGQQELDKIKVALAQKIEDKKNPKVGPLLPPWV